MSSPRGSDRAIIATTATVSRAYDGVARDARPLRAAREHGRCLRRWRGAASSRAARARSWSPTAPACAGDRATGSRPRGRRRLRRAARAAPRGPPGAVARRGRRGGRAGLRRRAARARGAPRRAWSRWPWTASWSRRPARLGRRRRRRRPAPVGRRARAARRGDGEPPRPRPARPRALVEHDPRGPRRGWSAWSRSTSRPGTSTRPTSPSASSCRGRRAAWRLYAALRHDQPRAVRRLPARGRARDRVRVAGAAADVVDGPRDHAPPGRHAPALRRPGADRALAAELLPEREGARRAPDARGPGPQRPRPGGGHRQRRRGRADGRRGAVARAPHRLQRDRAPAPGGATPSTRWPRSSRAAPSPACPRSAAWRSSTGWSRSPRGFYTGALFYVDAVRPPRRQHPDPLRGGGRRAG